MTYWDEVKNILIKGVEKAAQGIKEGSILAYEKTKDGFQIVKLKSKLFEKQKELQNFLADIGSIVIDGFNERKDIYIDPRIENLIEKAEKSEAECKKIQQAIDSLKV